jgi:hypothetical protein
MKKNIAIFCSIFFVTSCSMSRDVQVTKSKTSQSVSSQSIIYALPLTSVHVTIDISKTSVKKGIYADYAMKYLNMANVPMADSETFAISNVNIDSRSEADASQYYSITYKTYPDNLNKLLSFSNNGVVLDFANSWKGSTTVSLPETNSTENIVDPYFLSETTHEKVDTFYKTVMTDSSIVKIPVIKKQIQTKTIDDYAKEAAANLIKTRKRKLKILRGEYDFHPDGEALKVMIALLNKQEEHFYELFAGARRVEKNRYTYSFIPQQEHMSKDLCYFSPEKGLQENSVTGGSVITVQLMKEQEPAKEVLSEKSKNMLYVRIPIQSTVTIKLKTENIATTRMPVYQFGSIKGMPLQ